jgi:hypothetical protein
VTRTRILITLLAALTLAVLVPSAGLAQEKSGSAPPKWAPRNQGFAASATMHFPNSDFGTRSKTGYGMEVFYVHPVIPLVTLTGSLGYSHFPGESDLPAVDMFIFTGGFRFEFGAFYMGGEGGYYSELDEAGFVPSIGFHIKKFEIAGRWKSSGKSTWTSLRLGYYF